MAASVGLCRGHILVFSLDPDFSILESFAVGATHGALDGLAKGDPRKNSCHRYKRSGQYFCSIKHENILRAAKINYQLFHEYLQGSPTPNPCGRSILLRGGFQPRSRDAAQLK